MLRRENKRETRIFWKKRCAWGVGFCGFFVGFEVWDLLSSPPRSFPQARKVSVHLVCCEFLLLSSYVSNVSRTLATLKAALSGYHFHKAVAGLCVMPPSSTRPFYTGAGHQQPVQARQGFCGALSIEEREEFNCGKKQSSPDSETKGSHFLKISGKKESWDKPLQCHMARRVFQTGGRKRKSSRDSKLRKDGKRLLAKQAEVNLTLL